MATAPIDHRLQHVEVAGATRIPFDEESVPPWARDSDVEDGPRATAAAVITRGAVCALEPVPVGAAPVASVGLVPAGKDPEPGVVVGRAAVEAVRSVPEPDVVVGVRGWVVPPVDAVRRGAGDAGAMLAGHVAPEQRRRRRRGGRQV